MIRPVISLVLRSILVTTLQLCGWTATCWILGNIPLEFHWLTSILFKTLYSGELFFEPCRSVIQCHICLRVLVHLSKAQYRVWEYVDFRALETDDLFITSQRQILPWRVFRMNSFHSIGLIWLFGYQFFRYVKHLFRCEIFCISHGLPIVWVILHHEYRCLQCWRHIPHFTDCVSLSFVASTENCFCLLRTWSFTLCKNDLDPNDNSVSSSSIPNWCARSEQTTGLRVLSSINSSDFHPWEDQVVSILHSE